MIGVEIDIAVSDCISALELYEKIFEVQRREVTAFEKGLNEAVFSIYGTQFHLLDENPECGVMAAKPDASHSMWLNVTVPDIFETFHKAIEAGCKSIHPPTEMKDFGIINAFFIDPFGILWMLHQIVKEVSFEERIRLIENMKS